MPGCHVSPQEQLRDLSALAHHPAQLRQNRDACTTLWLAAIREYARDVRAYDRNGRSSDGGEAYADLLTNCALLANLCVPLGLDLEAARDMVFRFVG